MTPSTFGERFQFARLVQAMGGISETDSEFAEAVGVGSSSVTAYKSADEAPPASRVLVMAQRTGVDPGWLSFGEATAAPAPAGFDAWLERRRQALDARSTSYQRVTATIEKAAADEDLLIRRARRVAEVEPKDVPAPRSGTAAAKKRGSGRSA